MASKKPSSTAWQPGQSGNPNGRPKGSGEVAAVRAAIAQAVPQVLQTLIERALDGDVGAARLLLERTVPALKPAELPQVVTLTDGSLSDQGRALLAAVGAGHLSPSQGAALIAAVGALARVVEVDEISRRLDALEGKTNDQH